jgi:hypothetical protein
MVSTLAACSKPAQLKAPPEERTSAYEVTWSLRIKPKGSGARALELEYQVRAFEELYIADRSWADDAVNDRVPDPFGVYRFVQNHSLRLVLADAPYPPNVYVSNRYPPLYSRGRAGETRRNAVWIELPVDEYSALSRDIHSPTVIEDVTRVYFVLGVRLRSTMAAIHSHRWVSAARTSATLCTTRTSSSWRWTWTEYPSSVARATWRGFPCQVSRDPTHFRRSAKELIAGSGRIKLWWSRSRYLSC